MPNICSSFSTIRLTARCCRAGGRVASCVMSSRRPARLAVLMMILALLVVSLYWTREDAGPKLWFYAWKKFSGSAHGGRYVRLNGVDIYFETYGIGPPSPCHS